jgi:drug/metabolite transporter (DMT)-like permease
VRRVLIIAPEHGLWSPIGRTLSATGSRVVVATDIRDGREILECGRFDLAFVAIGAPASVWRQDALALLEWIRGTPERQSLPVIALVRRAADPWIVAELRSLGFDEVVDPGSEQTSLPGRIVSRATPVAVALSARALSLVGEAPAAIQQRVDHIQTRHFAIAVALLAGVGLAYGLVPSLSRLGAIDSVSLFLMNCLANLIAAVTLGVAALARGESIVLDRASLVFFAAAGALHLLAQLCLFHSSAYLPASTISTILVCEGFMSFVIASMAGLETARWSRLAGLALGFLGLLILVQWGDAAVGVDSHVLALAVTAALGVPLCFALEGVLWAARRPARIGLCTTNAVIFGISAAAMAPLALLEGTSSLGTGDSMLFHLAMIALIGISFAAGNLMFMRLVQTSGPVFASQNAYSIMLFGIAWGVLLLGEHLSDWAWAAILLVLLGLFLVGQRNTEPHEAEAPAS